LVFIAEIKKGGKCELNGPWTKPSNRNLDRVLSAIGLFDSREAPLAAKELYENEIYKSAQSIFRLITIAATENPVYTETKPNVLQITWEAALTFVHQRFSEHRSRKMDHGQWDPTGTTLWDLSNTQSSERFVQKVTDRFSSKMTLPMEAVRFRHTLCASIG
jgi:hypothetical protein